MRPVRRCREFKTLSIVDLPGRIQRHNSQTLPPQGCQVPRNAFIPERAAHDGDAAEDRRGDEEDEIGAIQRGGWLTNVRMGTRSDVAFAVTLLSRSATDPGESHWLAVKMVSKYLKGTRDFWLTYGPGGNLNLEGYGDADGSMQEDRHAISGNAVIVNGGAIS